MHLCGQVDDDVQSLREECARLLGVIEKRDARILQLEENLAQVGRAWHETQNRPPQVRLDNGHVDHLHMLACAPREVVHQPAALVNQTATWPRALLYATSISTHR